MDRTGTSEGHLRSRHSATDTDRYRATGHRHFIERHIYRVLTGLGWHKGHGKSKQKPFEIETQLVKSIFDSILLGVTYLALPWG